MSHSLLESIANLQDQGQELETLLDKLVRQLAGNGINLSVNIIGKVRSARQAITAIREQGLETITHLGLLEELIQKSAEVNSSLELERVLEKVLKTVVEITGAERANLMLNNAQTGKLEVRVQHNWDNKSFLEQERYSSSVVETALEQRQTIITTNAQMDSRFGNAASIAEMNLLSILCIPLVLAEETIGVLYADSRIKQGIFHQNLIPLLSAFATQAAIAIKNARTFEQVKDDLEQARREVMELRIQVDQEVIEREARTITESVYFQALESMVSELREEFEND